MIPGYAELHCLSNFSFQRGASHPHEMVERAYNLGYEALAITDECSMAGVVQVYLERVVGMSALETDALLQPLNVLQMVFVMFTALGFVIYGLQFWARWPVVEK